MKGLILFFWGLFLASVASGLAASAVKDSVKELVEGKPRPSQGRYTFVSWKFFTKDSPLLPSGLLGPVTLESVRFSCFNSGRALKQGQPIASDHD